MAILPEPGAAQPFGAQSDNQEQVRKTDALLTSAQVAIYPVGAEGVTVDSLYSAGADSRLTTRSELAGRQGGAQQQNANHAAMDQIASA